EYLVCADLILNGYIAYLSEQGLHYDIILDDNGSLLRLQVKTTREPKAIPQRKAHTPAYLYWVKRMGKGGKKEYKKNMIDIFAFVALDIREIAYMRAEDVPSSLHLRSRSKKYLDDQHIERASKILKLRKAGFSYEQISKEFNGMDKSHISKIITGRYNINKRHKYFSDYPIKKIL
ncbi:unnamed protein product, partial [marine sediment metagenome]